MKNFHYREKCQDISVYKEILKKFSEINLRRSSKFNVLAIFGALQCMQDVSFTKNLGIYIVTRYAAISGVVKVLDKHKIGKAITPFEFLNINSNNAAFYVSKALGSTGKNMVLTTEKNEIEDGITLAKFDLELGLIENALVGLVDESVDWISNDASLDISDWVYFS